VESLLLLCVQNFRSLCSFLNLVNDPRRGRLIWLSPSTLIIILGWLL
jgi:hypothetical protein